MTSLGSERLLLRECWRSIRDGLYDNARRQFDGVPTKYPGLLDAPLGRAWACLLSGRDDEGVRLMNAYINCTPPHFRPLLVEFEQEAQEGTALGIAVPQSAGEALMLSHAALYRKDAEEGLRQARRAADFAPDNGFVEANIACCLGFAGRYEKALPALRAVLPRFSTAAIWNNIAFCEYKLGHSESAVEAARCALELVPDYAPSHSALCWYELRRFHLITACRHFAAGNRARSAAHRVEEVSV